MRGDTKNLTLMALLASVYVVGSFLPGFPMIGVPGSRIDFVRSLEMSYGLILGPILGPCTAFMGAIVGKSLSGGGVGMFFTPLALVSSFMAASMKRKRLMGFKGWVISAFILACLILGWYATPTGREAPYYPIFHLVALGIILVLREKLCSYLNSEDKRRLTLGILLTSFSSTMAGHMLGNLIFIILFKPSALFFMTILPVSLVERVVLTTISTVIGVPLLITVKSQFPEFGD